MNLREKTVVITGANTGIGRANALALAERGVGRLVIAARSLERTQPVLDQIRAKNPEGKVEFVSLDLSDLASVKKAADAILEKDFAIDVLVNNAGIAGVRGQTKDGFELAFGTNHVGHYLWTERLLPLVKRAKQGRIVVVASHGHYRAKHGIDWDAVNKPSATFSAFPEYCVSKLANVLHASELARRLAGTTVTTYAVHPGGVASDIWKRRMGALAVLLRPLLITNEEGAKTQLRCELAPELASETGLYYDKERPRTPSALARDVKLQDELRARSDEYVAAFL
ncbi:MAG TPA: SDR family oxidoreductase [Labilithrix sp.]|jgi:NAD(P)-dependent dehydrogenase (short-subunit alcohol dehydrogenase family)|nr:SDR family oxidoreductase [Labilithrix sp.]